MKKRKLRIFPLFLAFLVLGEIAATVFYAKKMENGTMPPKIFRRFLSAKLLYPSLTKPGYTDPQVPGHTFLGSINELSPSWARLMPADTLLGWRWGKKVTGFDSPANNLYVINEQGFASSGEMEFSYEKAKPAGVFRVIVLGGSTVFGIGAHTPAENLPGQLRKALAEELGGQRLEVINAGVSGYDSGQELLYLMSELAFFQPDLVIAYNGWNDFQKFSLKTDYEKSPNHLKTQPHYMNDMRLNETFSILGSLRLFLGTTGARIRYANGFSFTESVIESFSLSHFGLRIWERSRDHYLSHIASKPEPTPLAQTAATPAPKKEEPPVPAARPTAFYRDNLELMAHVAEKHKFKLALFLQPIRGVDNKEPTEEELKKTMEFTGNMEMRKVFYADARPLFADLRKRFTGRQSQTCAADLTQVFQGSKETVYADSGHLIGRGNELMAQAIRAQLKACGMLPKKELVIGKTGRR